MTVTAPKNLKLFVRLTKIDEANRMVYGRATDETVDDVNEVMDYETSKPFFAAWSEKLSKATDGKSKGNLRAMHGKVAAGRLDQLEFNDDDKAIDIAAKVVDDNEWQKALDGVYTGFSIGGKYAKKWKDGNVYRYTCDPVEISLVDLPCNPSATFDAVKADGAVVRKFFQPGSDLVAAKVLELAKAAGVDPEKAAAQFEQPAREELAKTIHDPAPIEEVADPAAGAAAVTEPTNEQIVAKAAEIAKAKGGSWTAYTDEARTALLAGQAAAASPGAAETTQVDPKAPPAEKNAPAAPAAAPGAQATDGEWEQVWVTKRLPGQAFKKKADMVAALTALDATEKAAKAAGPVTTALGKVKDLINGVATVPVGDMISAEVKKSGEAIAAQNNEALAKSTGVDIAAWPAVNAWARANAAHSLVKALAGHTIKVDKAGNVIEVPAETVTALKAIATEAARKPQPSADELAALVKAGEARGTLVVKTVEDLEAAIARTDLTPGARRFVAKRARVLKAEAKLPAGWAVSPAAIAADAGPELKKGATLYGLCRMLELLASLQSCEDGIERNDIYCGVPVPAEMSTRFGTMLVEFGDLVADLLDVLLQAIRDEESGEAMTRAAAAHDLLKGALLAGDALATFAAPGALEKLAPAGVPAEALTKIADLEATIEANETAFGKAMGDVLKVVEELGSRLKSIEDTPLPPGTSSVTKGLGQVVEKTGDGLTASPAPLTPEQALSDPNNLAKLADIAVRAAHARPVHAVPGHAVMPTRQP